MNENRISTTSVSNNKSDFYGKLLIWSCFFVYVIVMGSKNAYTAEIVTLQGVFNKSKAELSLAMTYYFITYAIVQLILSVIMKKINLKIYLTLTLIGSSILTIMIGLVPPIEYIYAICSINGILQAATYSGCMAILSNYLPYRLLGYANKAMSAGGAVAGIVSYGVPAYFVAKGQWNMPFILLGILFFISVVLLFFVISKVEKCLVKKDNLEDEPKKDQLEKPYLTLGSNKKVIAFIFIMMFVTLLANCIYYGTMNWIPDLMHSVFNMPQEYSILITLLIPIAMFFGAYFSVNACEKYENIFKITIVSLLISLVNVVLITLFYEFNVFSTLILFVVFFSISQFYRSALGGIIAFKMRTEVNSGSFLAATNACASIGAGVAPVITGTIIDSGTGNSGFLTLFICVCGVVLLLNITLILTAIYYKKFSFKRKRR